MCAWLIVVGMIQINYFFGHAMTGVGPKCSVGMRNRTEYLVLFMQVWVIWRSFGGLAGPRFESGIEKV